VNRPFTALAVLLSTAALFLATRSQPFTRVASDGNSLRMLIAGTATPTVVFENGLGPPLEMWGKVQPEVSRFARTVAYDRAGVGLSEGPSTRNSREVAAELRRALRAAGVRPPYVLVGASLGGLYVRAYAEMYPEEVHGIVLVDPTHDAAPLETRAPLVLIDATGPREVPFASRTIRRLRADLRREIDAESRAYRSWVDAIPAARLVITDRSGHNVPIEQPDLVIETIREVVGAARAGLAY
jgi:pimeloyl-ACP methyl ester carboxylesterase